MKSTASSFLFSTLFPFLYRNLAETAGVEKLIEKESMKKKSPIPPEYNSQ